MTAATRPRRRRRPRRGWGRGGHPLISVAPGPRRLHGGRACGGRRVGVPRGAESRRPPREASAARYVRPHCRSFGRGPFVVALAARHRHTGRCTPLPAMRPHPDRLGTACGNTASRVHGWMSDRGGGARGADRGVAQRDSDRQLCARERLVGLSVQGADKPQSRRRRLKRAAVESTEISRAAAAMVAKCNAPWWRQRPGTYPAIKTLRNAMGPDPGRHLGRAVRATSHPPVNTSSGGHRQGVRPGRV
jgi:hypothetical protein